MSNALEWGSILATSEDSGLGALGKAVAARRVTLGMKRKDLAAAAELSYPYIAEIENGGMTPSRGALNQIASALGWSTSDLIRASEEFPNTSGVARTLGPTAAIHSILMTTPIADAGPEIWSRREIGLRDDVLLDEPNDEIRLLNLRIERLEEEVRALRTELSRLRGSAQ